MEVIIDNKAYLNEILGGNLQDILEDLSTQALGQEKIIGEVKINGQPYEIAKMGAAEELARESIRILEVDTLNAREVALHFLTNGHQYLNAIGQSCGKVAELFRVADEKEASEHYLHTLDSLQLFLHVLQSSREALQLDFDRAIVGDKSASERLERLSALISELLEAQEQEDWILLADILEYDLASELEQWKTVMPALKELALS